MAYGFNLYISRSPHEVTITDSHNGEGIGAKIIQINGRAISALTVEEIEGVLTALRKAREDAIFILDTGATIKFGPKSAPDDEKWKPRTDMINEPISPAHPLIRSGLEFIQGAWRKTYSLRMSAIRDVFSGKK